MIATYEPAISTGVYSYATHGAVVAVDPETGAIELLDFVVAEDCGTMVNPMMVEAQIHGGVVQGIGTAMCEEIPYDDDGPAARRDPARLPPAGRLRIAGDQDRPSAPPGDRDRVRYEGHGRGRAVAPPAAIANAVRDALAALGAPTGAEVNETPITAPRVLAAIKAARGVSAPRVRVTTVKLRHLLHL